ncbi:hypothetical protein BKA83DRAFT_4156707, partial [Pisolithus microcarpus]
MLSSCTFVPISATAVGMSNNFPFYFPAIANAASALGRLSAGFLADHIGPLNVMIPFTSVAGILTFAWPYALTALRGHISLLVTPPMAMGDVSDVGRRMGMFLTIAALSALPGTPISGLINARTGGFKDPGIYTGAIVMFSVLLFFVVRYLHLGRLYGKC